MITIANSRSNPPVTEIINQYQGGEIQKTIQLSFKYFNQNSIKLLQEEYFKVGLLCAKSLIIIGEFEIGEYIQSILEEFPKPIQQIETQLVLIHSHILKRNLNLALDKLDSVEEQLSGISDQHDITSINIQSKFQKALIMYGKRELNQNLSILHALENDVQSIKNKYERNSLYSNILMELGKTYRAKKNFEKSLSYLQKSLDIRIKMKNKHAVSRSYNSFGIFYYHKGDWEKAIDYFKLEKATGEEIGVDLRDYDNLGACHNSMGNQDKALSYFLIAYKINQIWGNKERTSVTLNNIGNIFRLLGQTDNAITYLTKSLKIEEMLDSKYGVWFELSNLGRTFILKGDLQAASKALNRSLPLVLEVGNDSEKSDTYVEMGRLNILKGEVDKAMENFLLAYSYVEDSNHDNYITEPIYQIIRLYVSHEKSLFDLSEGKLQQLYIHGKKIGSSTSSVLSKHRILLTKYLMLKRGTKSSEEGIRSILTQVMLDEVADIELTSAASLYYTEELLDQFKDNQSQDIANEIDDVLNEITKKAQTMKAYPLLIRIYLLRSRIAELTNQEEAIIAFMTTSLDLAKEKKLNQFIQLAQVQIDEYLIRIADSRNIEYDKPFDELYSELNLSQYIKTIIDHRLEFLNLSSEYHLFKSDRTSYCGMETTTSENQGTCNKCREITLNESLENIAFAHLYSWECVKCFTGLSTNKITTLLQEQNEKFNREMLPRHEFLRIRSPFLQGTLMWNCQNIKCSNKEDFSFDFEEIKNLFDM